MSKIPLRKKFIIGIAGLSVVMVLLIASSLRAVNSLDAQLNKLAATDTVRVERIGTVVNGLIELTALHKDQLLRSILSDTAGASAVRAAVSESEARIDTSFTEIGPLLETAHDRDLTAELKNKVAAAKQISSQIDELVTKQQMAEALKLVSEKLIPSYSEILKDANNFRDDLRNRRAAATEEARASASHSRMFTIFFAALTLAALLVLLTLFRRIIVDLTKMAMDVGSGAFRVAGAAAQVKSVSGSLAQGVSEQAASLEQTSASAEQINAMVHTNADNSQEAARLTSMADKLLGEANLKLDQMLGSMKDISDSSEKISKIIRVIDEIAFQTNMLSLNAAVEAARAGEAGMGFAVVAEEVRNLAQRCSQAARDTSALIEESIDLSKVGKVHVDEVAVSMRQVTENSSMVGRLSQEVSSSSAEQVRGIEQISKAIAQIQMVTQSNATNAEQGAAAGAQLTQEAEHLQSAVDHFAGILGIAVGNGAR